jgi:hypothetical protein
MSDRRVSAILGALMVLLVAGLLDNIVLKAIPVDASVTVLAWGQLLGYGVIAGGILLLGALVRSVTSLLVSATYLVLGGFFAFLFVVYAVAIGIDDSGFPVAFPGSLLQELYLDLERGPVNALALIGSAMLLLGLTGIVGALRDRRPVPAPGTVVATRES